MAMTQALVYTCIPNHIATLQIVRHRVLVIAETTSLSRIIYWLSMGYPWVKQLFALQYPHSVNFSESINFTGFMEIKGS